MQSWAYYPAMAVFVNGINTEDVPRNLYQSIFGTTNRLSDYEMKSLFVLAGLSRCRASVPKGKWESMAFRAALKKINGFQSRVFSTLMREHRSRPVRTGMVYQVMK